MEETKTEAQLLQDRLSYEVKDAWEKSSDQEKNEAFSFCEGYKKFLDAAKTEREFTNEVEKAAKANGFISLDEIVKSNTRLKPGMKIYQINRKKSVALSVIGTKPIVEGINILGAHIDAPRIDLKQNPLYEDTGMVLLKTHYYGGIKKYQWVTIPLALHGVFVKTNGEIVDVVIGEEDQDPVFTITDLLPHLAQEQMQKKMSEAITGEGLNLLFGSIPYNDEKVKNKVKLNILNLLNMKYGVTEEDFTSAELEIVPAFRARDVGFDRSFIGAYGQDDRVCAYTALHATFDVENPERTTLCILTDKEEIGSVGNTGAQAAFFQNYVAELCSLENDGYNDLILRKCLSSSRMISADVNAGVDPNYEGVQDKRNASFLGKGIIVQKYTGARGKSGASDANAEFLAYLRRVFNENSIMWQTGELGKVDLGGGGTIALYMANMGIEVVDSGVALLSMHAPYEISSKIDVYVNYKAYKAFYKSV